MEHEILSSLCPKITIKNNTSDILNNITIYYDSTLNNSISIQNLLSNSSMDIHIDLHDLKDETNLYLTYFHNEIQETELVYNSLSSKNLIHLTLEINEEDSNYVVTTVIERNEENYNISLSQKESNSYKKIILILATTLLIGSIAYLTNQKRH